MHNFFAACLKMDYSVIRWSSLAKKQLFVDETL